MNRCRRELWSQAEAAGHANPDSIVVGLFVESLNQMIDVHTKRITAMLRNRIPGLVWVMLYLVAIGAMTMVGYQGGLAASPNRVAIVVLSLTFAVVLALLIDMDRPHSSGIQVNQQVLVDLWEKLAPKHEQSAQSAQSTQGTQGPIPAPEPPQ